MEEREKCTNGLYWFLSQCDWALGKCGWALGHCKFESNIMLEGCQDLVESGAADLDVIEQRGTPCIPSVFWDVDVIKFFLEHGRNINARDKKGNTALIYAASKRLENVVQFLLDNSADPNVRNRKGETAFYKLVVTNCDWIYSRQTSTRIAKALIEGGADVNLKTTQELTLLHIEPHFDTETFKWLLDKFEDVDIRVSKSNYENTPLMVAARGGNAELCLALIDRNADVNAQNSRGLTPLHYAVYSKNFECVELLLASGSDPNIKSFSRLDAFDMYRFTLDLITDERLLNCFEDSIKKIEFYEFVGASYILRDILYSIGCSYWESLLEIRTELNLPKPEPTLKQKAIFKIQDTIRTKQQLDVLVHDREAMYRQALLTVDTISKGSNLALLRALGFLLSYEYRKLSLVNDLLRYISENIYFLERTVLEEYEFNALSFFLNHYGEIFRLCSFEEVLNFIKSSVPFVYNIHYHVLRKIWNCGHVPTSTELYEALNLAQLIKQHDSLEQIMRSNIEDFFTKIVSLGLKDRKGNTLLHLACNSTDHNYCANLLIDCGANVKEVNVKNQEPIQLLKGLNVDFNLVLKMVELGAHLDAKPEDQFSQSAFEALEKRGIAFPYVSLQCLAARVLARSCIHYDKVLSRTQTDFVNLHLSDFNEFSELS